MQRTSACKAPFAISHFWNSAPNPDPSARADHRQWHSNGWPACLPRCCLRSTRTIYQYIASQERIFARAGLVTLCVWEGLCGLQAQPLIDALQQELLEHRVLHADKTPVAMLKPGNESTHRAYLWAYGPGAFEDINAVVYDFCESRFGEHARAFLGDWKGALVFNDFSGYKQLFTPGVTEAGCMAHAQRKFFDLHTSNKSTGARSQRRR